MHQKKKNTGQYSAEQSRRMHVQYCITDRGSIACDLREQLRGLCEGGLTMCTCAGLGFD